MNKGKTIFSQIMSLIPERDFKTCVDRYKGKLQSKKLLLQRPIPSNELCSINRS